MRITNPYMYLVQAEDDIQATKDFISNTYYGDYEEDEDLEDFKESYSECKTIEDFEDWFSERKMEYFQILDTDPTVTNLFTGYHA